MNSILKFFGCFENCQFKNKFDEAVTFSINKLEGKIDSNTLSPDFYRKWGEFECKWRESFKKDIESLLKTNRKKLQENIDSYIKENPDISLPHKKEQGKRFGKMGLTFIGRDAGWEMKREWPGNDKNPLNSHKSK